MKLDEIDLSMLSLLRHKHSCEDGCRSCKEIEISGIEPRTNEGHISNDGGGGGGGSPI